MDEKIITIESKRNLKTKAGRPYIGFTDIEGERYSLFKPAQFNLIQEGKQVKLIGSQGDEYFDIEKIEPIEPQLAKSQLSENRPDLISRELNTLIMAAKDLWIAGKLTNDDTEIKALRKLMCLRFDVSLWEETQVKEETQTLSNPIDAGADKVNAVKNPAPRDPYSLKNLGELFLAIYKDFGMTKTQALRAWGYETQEQIKDIPGCYQFIADMEESRRKIYEE